MTELDACLDCALEFDIWQYYGDSVSTAAKACGLDATPLSANATTTGGANSTTLPTTAASSASSGNASAEPTTTATSSDGAAEASATADSSGTSGVSQVWGLLLFEKRPNNDLSFSIHR